jgi:anti-anti-sigma regulatory factor
MTCKIEQFAGGEKVLVLRVSGRIQAEHVSTIKDLILRETDAIVLDLTEVTLVDRDVVNFLAVCEREGIQLRNCPPFLREWVVKERLHIDEGAP